MAFDNARTLNCYKLRTFVLLSMSIYRKQVVYFESFHGRRLVDFDPVWFLFLIHKARGSAYVAVVYKNIKQRQHV